MTVSKEVYEQTLFIGFSRHLNINPLKLIILEYVPYCKHVGCKNLQTAVVGNCTDITVCPKHPHCICCRALCVNCGKPLAEDFQYMCDECRPIRIRCARCLESSCFECLIQCEEWQLERCGGQLTCFFEQEL